MKTLGLKYYRRSNTDGNIDELHFTFRHLIEAGLSPDLAWMPIVEGLMLINKWNREAVNYTYFLK
jgi:hypothetical protein